MLVRKDGSIVGTIGGGAAEGEIMRYCVEMLRGSGDESASGAGDESVSGTGDTSEADTGDRPVSGNVGDGSGAYTELRHVDLSCSAEEDGMVCGGVIDVLLELV